jgi:hypothetical protein
MKWNHNGSILALAGTQADGKEVNLLQFYDPYGQVKEHHCTLPNVYVGISANRKFFIITDMQTLEDFYA